MSANSGRIKDWWTTGFVGLTDIGSKLTFTSAVAIAVISITTAVATVLAVTFTWVVVAIVIKSNSTLVSQLAQYTTLSAAVGGALLGLLYVGEVHAKQSSGESANSQGWKDWRDFVVVRKVKESEEITSFYLEPKDKGEIPSYKPGQYLTLKLDLPGQAKTIIRTYSLSDYTEPCTYYRLSVKWELPPPDSDAPPGLASTYMHQQVQEGFVLSVKPPSGKFVLDLNKSLPAVLVSNGVGITPLVSMAKAASQLNPNRTVWFVHGAREGSTHGFRGEILELASKNPNLHVHFRYSRPSQSDTDQYQSIGYVDTGLVRDLVKEEAEYFLCGSPPFLASLRAGLKAAGIPEHQVFFESFLKGDKAAKSLPSASEGEQEGAEIVFEQAGKTAAWTSNAGSLLDFAEANGLNPPYSCRQGICGTCACVVLEGEVVYQTEPTAEVEDGSVLICICTPKTARVVLDI